MTDNMVRLETTVLTLDIDSWVSVFYAATIITVRPFLTTINAHGTAYVDEPGIRALATLCRKHFHNGVPHEIIVDDLFGEAHTRTIKDTGLSRP